MQLSPREYFTIVRQIENHLDSGTYYVRATVRNARTDALIERVTLTDQGSLRFSTPWQVPADTSGLGFYIAILTEVFTDAAFTTKSPDYGDKMDIYLVDVRSKVSNGGGSVDVNYDKIEKIITQAFSLHKKEMMEHMTYMKKMLEGMEFPETNMQPVMEHFEKLAKMVQGIEIPPTDLSSVISEIKDTHKSILELSGRDGVSPIIEAIDASRESITENVGQIEEKLIKKLDDVTTSVKESTDQVRMVGDNAVSDLLKVANISFTQENIQKFIEKPDNTPKKPEINRALRLQS